MIAFLLICLVPAALIAAILPFVVFALMLETAARRASHAASGRHVLSVAKPARTAAGALHRMQWS